MGFALDTRGASGDGPREFPSAEKRSEFFEAMEMKEKLDYGVYQDPTI